MRDIEEVIAIAKRWIEKARVSRQAHEQLIGIDEEGQVCYCILGVLAEVHPDCSVEYIQGRGPRFTYEGDSYGGRLPAVINREMRLSKLCCHPLWKDLVHLNDRNKLSLNDIADWMLENYIPLLEQERDASRSS